MYIYIYKRLAFILDAVEEGHEGRRSEQIEGKEREEKASARSGDASRLESAIM